MRTTILLSLICFTCLAYGQEPAVEAVYYDTLGVAYKLEQKYTQGNTETYYTHDNSSSVCMKRSTVVTGDTILVRELFYTIFPEKIKLSCLINAKPLWCLLVAAEI